MVELSGYLGLFLAAFLAATIFPAQSEALLVGLLLTDSYFPALLILVASCGNVLGSVVNWFLGRGIESFRSRKWFPIDAKMLDRTANWYHRYGRWSLLASWVPIIGDPLTVVAGVLREPLWSFVLLVTVAKTLRYGVLGMVTLGFL